MLSDRVTFGPTWEQGEDGKFVLPELTLGWDILGWTARWLCQPDGPDAGSGWRFTAEQARFVLWWYAVDDRGRWLYRYGVLRRVKGWGKDPVGAVLSAVELAGPCRFSHFEDGVPVGVPHPSPWIQLAAVSKDQNRNTMTLFPQLFSKDAQREFGIDLGKEIIYRSGGGRIEAVTSSPRALEGGRPSFSLKNEHHHWLSSNDGLAMSAVMDRNLAKSRDGSSRALAITNAHSPGEGSDAETDWEAFQAYRDGRVKGAPFLYDSLEAAPHLDLSDEGQLRRAIRAARGDSVWLDEDRTVETVWDSRTPVSLSRRFYLNQIAAAEDAFFDPQEWDAAGVDDVLEPGEPVALGFDGSRTDDSSVLVAVRMSDGVGFLLQAWEKPAGAAGDGWEVDRVEVDEAVRSAFERFDVKAFFSDVHPWETHVDEWSKDFGGRLVGASRHSAVGWDMRNRQKEFVAAAEKVATAVAEGTPVHARNEILTRHAKNARRRTSRFGVSFGKEHRESAKKVDGLAALILARLAYDAAVSGRVSGKQASTRWVGV